MQCPEWLKHDQRTKQIEVSNEDQHSTRMYTLYCILAFISANIRTCKGAEGGGAIVF